ncbi:MAG: Sec-independent protein translocase protein TatB, partial [Acidimicrobiales bacterium]
MNVGAPEVLVILLVALIVLGPARLPEAARQVGKVLGEVRRVASGFQNEIRDAVNQPAAAAAPPPAPAPPPAEP